MGEAIDYAGRAADEAVVGADWARFTANDLASAINHLNQVACHVARDMREEPGRRFELPRGDIDQAWVAITKAIVNLGRAREALVRAREHDQCEANRP